jgi:ubiquitin carboxyl-terminal hydrolase 25
MVETIEVEEESIEKSKKDLFCSLVLNVSKENNNLYKSLDQLTHKEKINFKTDNNHETIANKSILFSKLPPVLIIQLQRASYNTTNKKIEKINLPFEFDEEVYVDRYLEKNKDDILFKRNYSNILESQLESLNNNLNKIRNSINNLSIYEVLNTSVNFIKEFNFMNETPNPEIEENKELTINFLNTYINNLKTIENSNLFI